MDKAMKWRLYFCAIAAALSLGVEAASAQLSGHGGPVRALAISADGKSVLSGSFDTSAIRWSLATESAEQVLRFHSDAVNAVIFLQDGRMAIGGADARITIWTAGRQQPDEILEGHRAPIVGLAVSPDGSTLASASWDSSVRLWPLRSGTERVLQGHSQNVNGVAFTPDGKSLVSVGYDLTLRIWPLPDGPPDVITLPSPLNAVAVAGDGEIATGGADGCVRLLRGAKQTGEIQAGAAPIVALAISPDGALIAAAGINGSVSIIDRKARGLLRTLAGQAPVWSVAFLLDDATLLTGGADGAIRRWNALTGEPMGSTLKGTAADPLAAYAGDHGAEIFRACVACHTLSENDKARAGPTLAGLFGRRIASLPNYRFSDALKGMNIVWTPDTVAKLFEVGPNAYTPGTKMPEQRIGSPEDRKALTDFLARATGR
jgi:cytochrome c